MAKAESGCEVLSDDGKTAKFRTKCDHCGAAGERTWTVSVKCGVTEHPFTCRKCGKKSPVKYHG